MKYKKFGQKIVLRIDRGEEIIEKLKELCKKEKILFATISGIGATNEVVIGFFEPVGRVYHSKKFLGNFEIASAIGNITTMAGESYIHLHATIGNSEHASFCGHLNSAIVSATFEAIIDIIDGGVYRAKDESTGLNIIDI
ncbi:MAG: DUF296 domain-containing protein [Candidatus Woesearchaeota archaeon]